MRAGCGVTTKVRLAILACTAGPKRGETRSAARTGAGYQGGGQMDTLEKLGVTPRSNARPPSQYARARGGFLPRVWRHRFIPFVNESSDPRTTVVQCQPSSLCSIEYNGRHDNVWERRTAVRGLSHGRSGMPSG